MFSFFPFFFWEVSRDVFDNHIWALRNENLVLGCISVFTDYESIQLKSSFFCCTDDVLTCSVSLIYTQTHSYIHRMPNYHSPSVFFTEVNMVGWPKWLKIIIFSFHLPLMVIFVLCFCSRFETSVRLHLNVIKVNSILFVGLTSFKNHIWKSVGSNTSF